MDPEHVIFQHPREFYAKMHSGNVEKAEAWFQGVNTTKVTFPEPDLESHFEAGWGTDGENYRDDVERWRSFGPLTNLTVLTSEKSGEKAYVVDTSDLVIGSPDDGFFFYMIGTCWAIIADLKTLTGTHLRVAFHLPGITANKDNSLGELLKVLSQKGRLSGLTIFYNSKKYEKEKPEDLVGPVLPEESKTSFVDMNQLDDAGVHDLFVKGDRATQFYNRGEFDEVTQTCKLWRLRSGDWVM